MIWSLFRTLARRNNHPSLSWLVKFRPRLHHHWWIDLQPDNFGWPHPAPPPPHTPVVVLLPLPPWLLWSAAFLLCTAKQPRKRRLSFTWPLFFNFFPWNSMCDFMQGGRKRWCMHHQNQILYSIYFNSWSFRVCTTILKILLSSLILFVCCQLQKRRRRRIQRQARQQVLLCFSSAAATHAKGQMGLYCTRTVKVHLVCEYVCVLLCLDDVNGPYCMYVVVDHVDIGHHVVTRWRWHPFRQPLRHADIVHCRHIH